MSVIFEDVEVIQQLCQNLHYLQFQFTQAVRLGKSLYYIQNALLRKVNMIENHFDDSDNVIVQAEVNMICTDGKQLYSLLQNGDVYCVEQPPRLLNSGHHYQWISPTTAIDNSHRGYFWRTHKQIYSHCKHISTCGDRLTLITIGGKIFNIQSEQAIPIPQLNGLKLNTYFKKSLLFNFGGVTVTESGDLFLFNQKLLRIKIKDIQDIFATEKNIIAIQNNNTILQFLIDDIKAHQFFTNQQIFQKMHYCNDVEFQFKKKTFLSVQILQSEFSMSSFAIIKDNKVLDTSLNITEKTLQLGNRSSVMMLKQSLFDEWDVKKKQIETRRSTTTEKQFETLPAEKPQKYNLESDGLSMTQKLASIREQLNFDRAPIQERKVSQDRSIRGSDIKEPKQCERNRQKSLIQLHQVIVDDVIQDIQKSPQPFKLDNLLNKIHVIKPEKTLDNLISNQTKQDDSLPTFQCEDQFTHNDTITKKKPTKLINSRSNKRQDSLSIQSGIDIHNNSEFMQQQDSFIEILENSKSNMDLPLQLNNNDKQNKFKKKTLDTIQSNENEQDTKTTTRLSIKKDSILQQSNRSPKKTNREVVTITERSSTIEQAKQDLENLVNIITKQKENTVQKVPKLRISSPPVGIPISRPESKVTPLKNRRASCESSQQDSFKMPQKIVKQSISSKMNTQQSFSSNYSQFWFDSHHFKPINTQQDSESQIDLKSAKTIFDQSVSKRSEKLLKKVSCSSQVNIQRTSSQSKKTSIISNLPIQKPPVDRKKQAILSKLFFRFDVRIKFHKLEFLNSLKYML